MKKTIFLSLFLVFGICEVYSQGRIYQIDGGNNFAAAVVTERFNYFQSFQEEQNWCWAACIQMILDYQGIGFQGTKSEQCEIVKKAFNSFDCSDKPANCYTIESGANGWIINGRQVKAEVDSSPNANELIDQLAYKNPVIIGLNMPNQDIGHAYVLTAIFFRESNGRKIPYRVVLRDPYPYDKYGVKKDAKQEFDWNDFKSRINCITYVTK